METSKSQPLPNIMFLFVVFSKGFTYFQISACTSSNHAQAQKVLSPYGSN